MSHLFMNVNIKNILVQSGNIYTALISNCINIGVKTNICLSPLVTDTLLHILRMNNYKLISMWLGKMTCLAVLHTKRV